MEKKKKVRLESLKIDLTKLETSILINTIFVNNMINKNSLCNAYVLAMSKIFRKLLPNTIDVFEFKNNPNIQYSQVFIDKSRFIIWVGDKVIFIFDRDCNEKESIDISSASDAYICVVINRILKYFNSDTDVEDILDMLLHELSFDEAYIRYNALESARVKLDKAYNEKI